MESKIQMIMRQTTFDYETTKSKLEQYKGDESKVIEDYLTDGTMKTAEIPSYKSSSLHQRVYNEIRSFMDEAVQEYEEKNERKKQVDQTTSPLQTIEENEHIDTSSKETNGRTS